MDLTRPYLLFGYLAALGTLQLLATHHQLRGLSLWDVKRAKGGYLLGTALLLGSALWFFIAHWEAIFIPGPAGGELVPMLGVDSFLAAATLLVVASIAQPLWGRGQESRASEPKGLEVSLGPTPGRLMLPQKAPGPYPAVCLLDGPTSGDGGSLAGLAAELVGRGFAVLAIQPGKGRPLETLDLLTLLPLGKGYLSQVPGVDAGRIAAVGYDLAADLVIRALAKGEGLRAGVALAPRLGKGFLGTGLPLLKELTLPQALAWTLGSREKRLTENMGAARYLQAMEGKKLLLFHGQEDALVPVEGLEKALPRDNPTGCTMVKVPGEGHWSLASSPKATVAIADWLEERLRRG